MGGGDNATMQPARTGLHSSLIRKNWKGNKETPRNKSTSSAVQVGLSHRVNIIDITVHTVVGFLDGFGDTEP